MDDSADDGLEVRPELVLFAFELMMPYAKGSSGTKKLEHNKELALCLIDWALEECDRGVKLLEQEAELAILRSRKDGGTTYLAGPFGLG